MYFFAVKALLRNFFEICRRGVVVLCALSIHCYFLFAKMLRASSQRRKAVQLLVINSYTSEIFFDLQ